MKKNKSNRRGVPEPEPEVADQDEAEITERAKELDKAIVELSPEQLKEMEKWLEQRVDSAVNSPERLDALTRIKQYRLDYLEGVARTDNNSGKGFHDYRSFEAAAQADGMKARLIAIFTENPIIKIEGRNKTGVDNAEQCEKYLDYHHDENIRLNEKGDPICGIVSVEGHVVFHTPWKFEIDSDNIDFVQEQRYALEGKMIWIDVNDKEAIRQAGLKKAVPATPEDFRVIEKKSERINSYPDLEIGTLDDYAWQPGAKPHDKITFEMFRKKYTYNELKQLEKTGRAYKGVSAKLKKYLLDEKDDEKSGGKKAKRAAPDMRGNDERKEDDLLDKSLYVWVIYGLQKIPGKDGLQSSITMFHKDSCTEIQCKLNENVRKQSAIQNIRLFQFHDRFAGIGMMEVASLPERYMTDILNYALDMARIFAALPFSYLKRRFPEGLKAMEFFKGFGVTKHDDIKERNFADRRGVDVGLTNIIRASLERRSAITDRHLGRVDDATSGKSTATEFLKVMSESQFKLTLLSFSLFNGLLNWAEYELGMFQKYGSRKLVESVTDKDGKELFPDGLSKWQILGQFRFVPNISAQNMVRELDAQMNLLIYDKFKDNPFFAKDLQALYNLTADTIKSMGKKKSPLLPFDHYAEQLGVKPSMTPDEQAAVQEGVRRGMAPEEIQKQIEEMRAGRPTILFPVNDGAAQNAEAQQLDAEAAGGILNNA